MKLAFLTALIPLLVGFVWFHPAVFGSAWMRASKTPPPDHISMGKRIFTFAMVYVFGLMLTMILMLLVIHQVSLGSIVAKEPNFRDPNSEAGRMVAAFMAKYGHNFRTFKHGAFHGTMAALFTGIPFIGTISLFERRNFTYFAVHMGYWIITMMLMGGVICQFF